MARNQSKQSQAEPLYFYPYFEEYIDFELHGVRRRGERGCRAASGPRSRAARGDAATRPLWFSPLDGLVTVRALLLFMGPRKEQVRGKSLRPRLRSVQMLEHLKWNCRN